MELPKGGGALRGMGEKFQANAANGTGTLTIPVPLSKSRADFQPTLTLTYGSGSGNGAFGLGWSPGLPSVSRRLDKGVPRYLPFPRRIEEIGADDGGADIFLLSGSDDLVPLAVDDGPWVAARVIDGHFVRGYRPRIEGTFARIESWTRLDDGDTHWRTLSRDNVLTVYGECPASRIADPADPQRVLQWLVSRSHDDRGNAIAYSYAGEGDDGIDLARPSERRRSRTANRYIKRILYGNRTPRSAESAPAPEPDARWLFEVVFDYGDEPLDVLPAVDGFERVRWRDDPAGARPARPDPFSTARAGFEIRTHRLCRAILVAHRMPHRLGAARELVRALHLDYDERRGGSRLASVTQSGYRRLDDGSLRRRSLPALHLRYTPSPLDDPAPRSWAVRQLAPDGSGNLPAGISGHGYRWTDLDGEGIAGVLAEQGGAWFYQANRGEGRFAAAKLVTSKPMGDGEHLQLLDLDGDGQLELAALAPHASGYFDRTDSAGWMAFRPFRAMPLVAFGDPNVLFVDLSGDGIADILITDDHAITWHRSLGANGFGEGLRVGVPWSEEAGPRVLLGQADQSVFLADMSGDGLSDLVRIRNGEVCYWPNLGYGRFGAKVSMDGAPWFEDEGLFDARRLRLADVDGAGPTDVLYAGRRGVQVYPNESGNALGTARLVSEAVVTDDVSLDVVDLLGRGTACLVWSTALPGLAWRPLRAIDLMDGVKPHLLVGWDNQLGAETRLTYASSTSFYVADEAAGRPWLTRLPFPVQVVERVETIDHVGGSRFVTRYAFHHGHYDGVEREFRGFGMVEQWDGETFASHAADPPAAHDAAAFRVPPVRTRTWFHTGAWLGRERITRHFEDEYFQPPSTDRRGDRARLLDDTRVPPGLTLEDEREACRALKGSMLRQEVYADDADHPDATPAQRRRARTPYTVIEHNFRIRVVQAGGRNRHAIVFVHPHETLTSQHERDPADPRVAHALTLGVDDFGNVLGEVAVAYGRRASPLREEQDRARQTTSLVTAKESRFTTAVSTPRVYRAPLPCETITCELTDCRPSGTDGHFRISDFEDMGRTRPRAVDWQRTLYRRDDLAGLLPLGELQSLALPGETYRLAFAPGLLDEVYRRPRPGQADEALLPDPAAVLEGEAGYVPVEALRADGRFPASDPDGAWWLPSGRAFYSVDDADDPATELAQARRHFFMPRRYRDPFGQLTCIDFDADDLLATQTRDALGNRVTVEVNDYRVLQPRRIVDANGNGSEVAFDTLAFVVGTAVMGKPAPAPVEGDTLGGFELDLPQDRLDAFFDAADPHARVAALLAGASTRIVVDLDRFRRTRAAHPDEPARWQPACAATLARETHASGPLPPHGLKIQLGFSYSDGFGREIQTRRAAAPGPLDANAPHAPTVDPRWIGSGWTVFNNKGKPVRRYEPFFSATHRFEPAVATGVGSVLFYDPADRVVATLAPDHSYAKVVFDAWRQTTFDANDTCAPRDAETGDPRTDPDVAGIVAAYFRTLPASWQTWHARRVDGVLGADERHAAERAAAHADTPTTAHVDPLGRTFLSVGRNRVACLGHPLDGTEEAVAARMELDIQGRQRAVRDAIVQAGDPLGRIVQRNDFDLLGRVMRQASMEAGARWTLNDVAGKPIRAWDSRGHAIAVAYDALRRPLTQTVRGTGVDADPRTRGRELLVERIDYGEGVAGAEALNLRTRAYRHFDAAGLAVNARLDATGQPVEAYDFQGNLLASSRRLVRDAAQAPDWRAEPALDDEVFEGRTRYDALGRAVQAIAPRSSLGRGGFNVVQHAFDAGGLLARVDVWLARDAAPAGWLDVRVDAPSAVGVAAIDYDARGQRRRIDYRNGARTDYRYDPATFRLAHLLTRRPAGAFPGDDPRPPDPGRPGRQVQNLHYTFDPVGNLVHVRDDAQQAVWFRNRRVDPDNDYHYDALYRLVQATGREHLGQGGAPIAHSSDDAGRTGLVSADAVGRFAPNDGRAMGRYVERYVYDAAGNFLRLLHRGGDPAHAGWGRAYDYADASQVEDGPWPAPRKTGNRLTRTLLEGPGDGAQAEDYLHDVHGNMVRMPHLGGRPGEPNLHWDYHDRMRQVDLGGGGRVFHVHDSAGQRVRKVWEKAPGLVEERLYLGGFEIFRRHRGRPGADRPVLERETLHVMDDQQRIALVETRTLGAAGDDAAPAQSVRYQFGNHLGSACLELDDDAGIVSYEEYAPYGSTTYQAVRSRTDACKRYRFTGKERDEGTGLYHLGARDYAPWLGRWTRPDPAGLVDGANLYRYARDCPVVLTDVAGTDPPDPRKFETFEQFSAEAGSPYSTEYLQSLWQESHKDAANLSGPGGSLPITVPVEGTVTEADKATLQAAGVFFMPDNRADIGTPVHAVVLPILMARLVSHGVPAMIETPTLFGGSKSGKSEGSIDLTVLVPPLSGDGQSILEAHVYDLKPGGSSSGLEHAKQVDRYVQYFNSRTVPGVDIIRPQVGTALYEITATRPDILAPIEVPGTAGRVFIGLQLTSPGIIEYHLGVRPLPFPVPVRQPVEVEERRRVRIDDDDGVRDWFPHPAPLTREQQQQQAVTTMGVGTMLLIGLMILAAPVGI